jgi:methylenetetrahydrofolate dehydrogenase (NADP+) / methenyltetrahydrofolate cyclohydrolase
LSNKYNPQISPTPKLGYVLVGSRPDSELYVKMKRKTCKSIGIDTVGKQFDESVSQEELTEYINKLNEDQNIDGILVQLPLPNHIDSTAI